MHDERGLNRNEDKNSRGTLPANQMRKGNLYDPRGFSVCAVNQQCNFRAKIEKLSKCSAKNVHFLGWWWVSVDNHSRINVILRRAKFWMKMQQNTIKQKYHLHALFIFLYLKMYIDKLFALAQFWHSSTQPMDVTNFDYSALMCDIGSDFQTKGRTSSWWSVLFALVRTPLSCSAVVSWKTVFALMCTQMWNRMIIPVIVFHPDWLSHLFMMSIEQSLSSAKRRHTSISRFQTKWNEMWILHNWWDLTLNMEKKTHLDLWHHAAIQSQNGWKFGEMTNDWNDIGGTDWILKLLNMESIYTTTTLNLANTQKCFSLFPKTHIVLWVFINVIF